MQAFNTLFSGYVPTNDPAAAAAAMRTRAKGRSIIDFVVKDIARINPRLAAVEQQKLQQHLDSIRDMEKQFAEPTGMMMAATCMPAKPNASQWTSGTELKLKRYNGGEPYFDVITNAFIDVLTQAFACDITRFATFYMADLSYTGNPLGLNADNHGGVAHTYNGSQLGNDGHPVGAGDAASWVPLAKFNRYSYGKIALFMQKMAAAGVLDNVLIYASSDMGNPSLHSTRNAPTVLAGGAAGTKFRMGRRLKMAADCMTNLWCSPDRRRVQGEHEQPPPGLHRAGVRPDRRHLVRHAGHRQLEDRHADRAAVARPAQVDGVSCATTTVALSRSPSST